MEKLCIFPPNDKGKLLVYPDNMSMHELAQRNHSLQTGLNDLKSDSKADIVTKAALKIRADIKKQDVGHV